MQEGPADSAFCFPESREYISQVKGACLHPQVEGHPYLITKERELRVEKPIWKNLVTSLIYYPAHTLLILH